VDPQVFDAVLLRSWGSASRAVNTSSRYFRVYPTWAYLGAKGVSESKKLVDKLEKVRAEKQYRQLYEHTPIIVSKTNGAGQYGARVESSKMDLK